MKVQRVLSSLTMCCANSYSDHGVDHLSSGSMTHPCRSCVAASWFHALPLSIVMLLVPTGLASLTKTDWQWVLRRPATEWSTTFSQWRRSWLVYHHLPVAEIVIGLPPLVCGKDCDWGQRKRRNSTVVFPPDKQRDFDVWCVLDVASMMEHWFIYDWTAMNWQIVQDLTPPSLRDSGDRLRQTPLSAGEANTWMDGLWNFHLSLVISQWKTSEWQLSFILWRISIWKQVHLLALQIYSGCRPLRFFFMFISPNDTVALETCSFKWCRPNKCYYLT